MWPGLSKGWQAGGGGGGGGGARSPREPAVPFRGSVEPLLGGELIEAVALSLGSELLSSLGRCGSTHQAELWPGLAAGLPLPGSLPGAIETGLALK